MQHIRAVLNEMKKKDTKRFMTNLLQVTRTNFKCVIKKIIFFKNIIKGREISQVSSDTHLVCGTPS